jgi:hypothetical protein
VATAKRQQNFPRGATNHKTKSPPSDQSVTKVPGGPLAAGVVGTHLGPRVASLRIHKHRLRAPVKGADRTPLRRADSPPPALRQDGGRTRSFRPVSKLSVAPAATANYILSLFLVLSAAHPAISTAKFALPDNDDGNENLHCGACVKTWCCLSSRANYGTRVCREAEICVCFCLLRCSRYILYKRN